MNNKLNKNIGAFAIGLLFGSGLLVSGMINPAVVHAFLDIFGQWDASLLFVMGGAIFVSYFGFKFVSKRNKTQALALGQSISAVDRKLLGGATLFGIGWGLIGLCPGPALAGFLAKPLPIGLFMLSMLAGSWLAKHRLTPRQEN